MQTTFDRVPSPDPTVQIGQEDILEARSLVPPLPSPDPTVQLGQDDILEARSLLDPPPPPVLDTTVLQQQSPPTSPRERSLLGLMVPGGIDDELDDLTVITDHPPRRVWRMIWTLFLGLVPVLGIAAAIAAQDYLFSSSAAPAVVQNETDVPIRVRAPEPPKKQPRIIHAKRPAKRHAVTAQPLALTAKTAAKAKAETAKAKTAAKPKAKAKRTQLAKTKAVKVKVAKAKAVKVKVAKAKAKAAKAKAAKAKAKARASKAKRRPARLAMRARKAPPPKGSRQAYAKLRRHLAAAGRAVQKQQWNKAQRHIRDARRIDRRNKTAKILALRVRKGMARERQVDRFVTSARRALKGQQWKRAKRQAARALRLDPRNRRAKKIKRVADLRLRKAKRQTG